jgi:hypothetical protein
MKCSSHSVVLSCRYSQSPSTAGSFNSLLQLPDPELDSILIVAAWDSRYITSERTNRKHRFLYYCVLILCCRNVFTAHLCSNEHVSETENAAYKNFSIFAWRHNVHDAYLSCVFTGHYLTTGVPLPPQFFLWANAPQQEYIRDTSSNEQLLGRK